MIDVYYWPTPNGKKVSIFLEESRLAYRLIPLNVHAGDQFSQEFLKLNPNHRMPVIVDHEPAGGGGALSVFESAAILFYLAEKTGQFWPQQLRKKYEVAQWVVWQAANQGPKLGEYGHFTRLGDRQGDQSYAVRRFSDETNRIYGVMNYRLYDRPYLAGDEYTIADMICYPYTVTWKDQGQALEEFPHFKRWFETVSAREGVQRGLAVGKDLGDDWSKLSAEELQRRFKILYNQRAIPAPSN
jgi:GST-like protein